MKSVCSFSSIYFREENYMHLYTQSINNGKLLIFYPITFKIGRNLINLTRATRIQEFRTNTMILSTQSDISQKTKVSEQHEIAECTSFARDRQKSSWSEQHKKVESLLLSTVQTDQLQVCRFYKNSMISKNYSQFSSNRHSILKTLSLNFVHMAGSDTLFEPLS